MALVPYLKWIGIGAVVLAATWRCWPSAELLVALLVAILVGFQALRCPG